MAGARRFPTGVEWIFQTCIFHKRSGLRERQYGADRGPQSWTAFDFKGSAQLLYSFSHPRYSHPAWQGRVPAGADCWNSPSMVLHLGSDLSVLIPQANLRRPASGMDMCVRERLLD